MWHATICRVSDAGESVWGSGCTYHDLPKRPGSENVVHLILLFLVGRRGLGKDLLGDDREHRWCRECRTCSADDLCTECGHRYYCIRTRMSRWSLLAWFAWQMPGAVLEINVIKYVIRLVSTPLNLAMTITGRARCGGTLRCRPRSLRRGRPRSLYPGMRSPRDVLCLRAGPDLRSLVLAPEAFHDNKFQTLWAL